MTRCAALAALATFWRSRFDIPVAVVTGSNGKTTTKEMIAAIFRAVEGDDAVRGDARQLQQCDRAAARACWRCASSHRLAVFEIGMNHRGETRELAAIAQPTIAVITNAQREHQEFMASVDEVAAEHADAIRALRQGGTAIVNADDPRAGVWHAAARDTGVDVVTFGLDRPADIRARHAPHPEGGVAGARDAVGQRACRPARAGPPHGLQRTGRNGCRVRGRRAVDGHRARTRGVPAGGRTARHAAHAAAVSR